VITGGQKTWHWADWVWALNNSTSKHAVMEIKRERSSVSQRNLLIGNVIVSFVGQLAAQRRYTMDEYEKEVDKLTFRGVISAS
jgi:hypothetical protein